MHPSGLQPNPSVLSSNAETSTNTVVRSAASTRESLEGAGVEGAGDTGVGVAGVGTAGDEADMAGVSNTYDGQKRTGDDGIIAQWF